MKIADTFQPGRIFDYNKLGELKNISVEIKVNFGSAYQLDFALKTLVAAIAGWRVFLQQSHKNNKIEVELKFNQLS